jgi:alkylhydroperoxidase family enzyme
VIPRRDQAIVAFAAAVVAAPLVSDDVFAAVHAVLDARQIVEALQVIGFYWSFGRTATVLQVEIEPAHGTAVVQASQSFEANEHAQPGQ